MKTTSPPSSRHPIIALDGPAGAGKSTIASKVAHTLGLLYLDTGAMYRAITWLVIQSGYFSDDTPSITQLVRQSQIEIIPKTLTQEIKINGHDVTQAIRTSEACPREGVGSPHKSLSLPLNLLLLQKMS